MAYAIVGYFDWKTDSFIKSLWKELADNEICSYLSNSENNPHIKFSMFNQLDIEKVTPVFNAFTRTHNKITVHLKNYGFFANETPTLFIDFAPSIQLIELENDIRNTFNKYGICFDFNYFDENIWMPSCQLTVKTEHSKLNGAIELLLKRPLQFDGILERIGIIEFHPAKQIVSCNLI